MSTAISYNKNNNLEFLSSFITVWLTILSELPKEFTCFVALGYNMSVVSWLHKANVDEAESTLLHGAIRKYA
jgi:hypothetical protein